jgi:hypothetical protein
MKTKLIIMMFVLLASACGTTSEFVPSSYMVKNQLQNTNVKLFLSEINAPSYQEIGLIRIETYNNNLMQATEEALKKIEGTNADCLVYKQMAAYGNGENSSYFTFEFIAGKLIETN